MTEPQAVSSIIKLKLPNTDINDNNDNKYVNKYRLNKEKFHPNTEATITAEEIANAYDDTENYAFYLHVVNKLGVQEAMRLHRVVQDDIVRKMATKHPVRDYRKYFNYIYTHKKY